jgi:tetratricopeptide (TPR) repeat protein
MLENALEAKGRMAHSTHDPSATLAELAQRGSWLRGEGRFGEAADAFAAIAAARAADWLAQHNAGAVALEAGRLDTASHFLAAAAEQHPNVGSLTLLGHVRALRGEMPAARAAYAAVLRIDPQNFDANWGIFEVAQLLDDNPAALAHQRAALAVRSLVSIPAKRQPARLTLLELCIAGSFQANVPLDFILDTEHVDVLKLYLGEHPIPPLPPYDLVFNAIADAPNAGPALAAAERFIASQDRPALNAPHLLARTSRDAVAQRFAASATVAVARTLPLARETLARSGAGIGFPFLIRPLDSHAGNDLAKIDDPSALAAYLVATPHVADFYVSEFIDYRNPDGFYRKYRIVFVDGVAYPVHLAISPRWMIHYYNAPMAENAWMRAEEHAFMRDMATVFDGVRAAGLREIAREIPLDYFGIDCSIAADGRVLLFEASSAMIVHLRDPVDLYPYKAQYVPRVVTALARLFDDRRGRPREPVGGAAR